MTLTASATTNLTRSKLSLPSLTEVQAAKARRSLLSFTEFTNPAYERAQHHIQIAAKLEAVERGEIDRLMIFMPPRHGKSELASKRFPAWALGRNPRRQIIAASYNSDLANDFGRNVRNIVAEPEFGQVFPSVNLAADSQAANRMNTNHGGAYVAAGVGTAVTGRGANIALIDDPFKDRAEADSERRREMVWDWYRSTLYTRLMPGGAIVLIQCMTGDTPVLMANGAEKQLSNIKVGDVVATYEDGALSTSTVLNWINHGPDYVYAIKMSSGLTVKANERHPFLVERDGKQEWVKLRDLRIQDQVIRAIGGSGAGRFARLMIATSLRGPKDTATLTIIRCDGQMESGRLPSIHVQDAKHISGTGMVSTSQNTNLCLKSRAEDAPFVGSYPEETSAHIGAESFALTIAMTESTSEACSVTTVILPLATERLSKCYSLPLDTFGITLDEIIDIVPAGRQDVFDIQIDRTENFIAGGLVSHNTRWHEDDLAGRLLEQDAGQWDVLELPAVDSLGAALWPEWYDRPALDRIKATIGPREWSALYQQKPQPDDGTFFTRSMFQTWETLPELKYYGTSDYAVTDGGGDYTVLRIWGIDHEGQIYRVGGWRGQTASDVWIEQQIDLIAKYKPLAWFGEGGVIQKAIEPMLKRRMRERQTFCRMEWMSSISDKPTRARSFQAMASSGRVYFERNADLGEFLVFPAGKHDDDVDCASLIGRAIDQAHPAILRIPPPKLNNPPDLWGRDQDQGAGDWRTV